jgi:hypothetical protein
MDPVISRFTRHLAHQELPLVYFLMHSGQLDTVGLFVDPRDLERECEPVFRRIVCTPECKLCCLQEPRLNYKIDVLAVYNLTPSGRVEFENHHAIDIPCDPNFK